MAGVGGLQSTGTGVGKPWYTFNFDNPVGETEPFGGGQKPDINVQLPDGYPVTALYAGTVTNLDTTSAWGCSITIRMDKPLNSLATHLAYLHLSGFPPQVGVGTHVNAGDIIGYNGGSKACGSQKVPLGFTLYSGDHYGFGPEYNTLLANIGGMLNPWPVLHQFASGQSTLPPSSNNAGIDQNVPTTSNCQPWDIPCIMKNLQGGVIRIGEGLLGGVLLIIGLLLAVKQISGIKFKTIAKVMK